MTFPQIEFKIEGLKEIGDRANRADTRTRISLNQGLRQIGAFIVRPLRTNTPKVTGKLRNSTRFQIVGGTGAQALEVRQGARINGGPFYGVFVREGTKPHVILPKKARALRFKIGTRTVFASKVNHPGNKPNLYHVRTLRQVNTQIQRIVTQIGERVTAFLAGR